MRKRGLPGAGLIFFLGAGLLIPAPSYSPQRTPGQLQPQRPQFYALQVLYEEDVRDPRNSLAAPDGHYAEIMPGGMLVVQMEKKLYPFPSLASPAGEGGLADSGSVAGKGKTGFVLEGWFSIKDAQGKQRDVWMPLGLSASGFCIWLEGSAGVDMIRITNPGTETLFVDAVIGYGRETHRR